MGDAPRRTWGPKYSLRKGVNRLTAQRKPRKMARMRAFCAWREPAPTAADRRPGRKFGDWAARLSVCLFGTTRWITQLSRHALGVDPGLDQQSHPAGICPTSRAA